MQKENKTYISVLNVLACIAVVFLHTNCVFWDFKKESYWITANVIEGIFYFAVPVFFMISGATLIDYRKRYSTKQYYRKRFQKILIPFLFWSLFGLLYQVRLKRIFIEDINLMYILDGIINVRFVDIYWFFVSLMTVYIAIPVLGYIQEEKRERVFLYVVVFGFILNIAFPFIFGFIPQLTYNTNLFMPMASGYLIYAIVGYWIERYRLNQTQRWIIYCCGVVGFLLHVVGTFYLSWKMGGGYRRTIQRLSRGSLFYVFNIDICIFSLYGFF